MFEVLNGETARDDTLLKKLSVDVANGNTGSQERYRMTWGQFRQQSIHAAGFGDDDIANSVGTGFLPTLDPESHGGILHVGLNDSMTFHLDNSATVEDQYGTATTITGDEQVRLTIFGFSGVVNPRANPNAAATELRGGTSTGRNKRGRRLGR
jgi:hypothetical protein